MTTTRKFAAFSTNGRDGLGISEIPKDGFCISVFVIIREANDPRRVLMGHLNTNVDWDHIGGLTPDRVEAHSKGWMLPSCHILYGEAPQDAAQRIVREQLEIYEGLDLSGPRVFSEVYEPKRHPGADKHWDLEFLFEGKLRQDELEKRKTPRAWVKLEFVGIDTTNKDKIARSHEDILARIP